MHIGDTLYYYGNTLCFHSFYREIFLKFGVRLVGGIKNTHFRCAGNKFCHKVNLHIYVIQVGNAGNIGFGKTCYLSRRYCREYYGDILRSRLHCLSRRRSDCKNHINVSVYEGFCRRSCIGNFARRIVVVEFYGLALCLHKFCKFCLESIVCSVESCMRCKLYDTYVVIRAFASCKCSNATNRHCYNQNCDNEFFHNFLLL